MKKQFLVAPGPTPVPERARLAMAASLIHHRGPEFKELMHEVREGLRWLFGTEQDVLVLTCSGTGGFESAIASFTRRGDTIISVGGGKFGERWGDVARSYGLDVVDVDVEWGEAVDPAAVAAALDAHPEAVMVTMCASETSTAVLHPVAEVAKVVRARSDALVAVDGITAVGVHRLPMDALGIDVLVSGSQKAFSLPPGLAFVAASERAWQRYNEGADHPRYYFDLGRERRRQAGDQTAFTPAITLVVGLRVVLEMMREEGLEAMYRRHEVTAEATRAGLDAVGLRLLASRPANSVTAALVPDGVSAPEIVRRMREAYGVTIAGGQANLKPRLVRIGHLGYYDRSDILVALGALELALQDAGQAVALGSALTAAQSVFAAT